MLKRLCLPLSLGWLAVVLVSCAWQSDDAYITYRTVENLLAGHGPVWNVGERVQSFTHPLWMLLVAAARALTGEIYATTLALSISLTVSAVALALRRAAPATTLATAAALTTSSAFIDYGTSGLENPLTFLLLALLWTSLSTPRAALIGLATAGLALTRPDAVLLALPALVSVLWLRRGWLWALVGLAPLFVWEGFSLVYYGSLVPNTAYAKLNVDIPATALLVQGGRYLLDVLRHDPITALLVVAGVTAGLWQGGRARLLALGVGLYVLYVAKIGGDFMAGRFLAAPAFGGALLLANTPHPRVVALVALALATVAGVRADSPWWSDSGFGQPLDADAILRGHGISDERRFYYPYTGLLQVWALLPTIKESGLPLPPHPGARAGVALAESGEVSGSRPDIGMYGYFAGSGVHLLDPYALNDPLLARLPYTPGEGWRIGHYPRRIPEGYAETLVLGENHLADPQLHAFYDDLSLVLSGPLWSPERLGVIWRLHTGYYAATLQRSDYR